MTRRCDCTDIFHPVWERTHQEKIGLLRSALEIMNQDRHERAEHPTATIADCPNPVCSNTMWVLRMTEPDER